jgi:hypothetical protein
MWGVALDLAALERRGSALARVESRIAEYEDAHQRLEAAISEIAAGAIGGILEEAAAARRLATVKNIAQQDSAERAFNKLTRTFVAQVEALKRYRSGGEQKMTVQHVHVAEGGQAIVGNVSAPAPGVGANEKLGGQPHALAYAPRVEMPCRIETERATVPSAGG